MAMCRYLSASMAARFVLKRIALCACVSMAFVWPVSVLASAPVPSLRAELLQGGHVDLMAWRGHVVIINFWATWCLPCRREMPVLNRLYQQYHSQGLEILGVSADEPGALEQVREASQHVDYPIALLNHVEMTGLGRVWAMPLLSIVDRQGVLRVDAWAGMKEADFLLLEERIKALLAEQAVAVR